MFKKECNKLNENYVVYSVNIQQECKNKIWKKKLIMPHEWNKFDNDNTFYNETYNSIALLTGKTNNIIVIDIDNNGHWNKFLEENDQQEPNTVSAKSGSGGKHFYF